MRQNVLYWSLCGLVAICVWTQSGSTLLGQIGAGVHIDANGVLTKLVYQDPDGRLTQQKRQAAAGSLNVEVAKKCGLRMVSLNRLEKALEEQIAAGKPATDEMLHLAGLQRVQFVFFYPETKDIVIAGPAEGWFDDQTGRTVGLDSGKPVLELQDLIVALRTFGPGKKGSPMLGCSIDPTADGLSRMQEFLSKVGRNLSSPSQSQFIVKGLQESLGMQTITITGVPGSTHFAEVMVEADYRMKLIGIGLEQPPIKMTAYVDLVNPATVSRNALQRWYFTPNYECVKVTEDRQAMELVGQGVKLVSEDELIGANGERVSAGSSNSAAKQFATGFTSKYPELADKSPVYAQLRNLIDLSIAAAYMQQEDLYGKADWKASTFSDEKLVEVENHNVPAKVQSAVNAIFKRNLLMTPIGGGVEIRPKEALKASNLQKDSDGKLSAAYEQTELKLPQGRWWWDR